MTDTSTTVTTSSTSNAPTKAGWILLVIAWILFLIPFPGLGWLGWIINFVAFIVAIVVIVRGAVGIGIIQIVCSTVVSGIVYFIGLAIFAAVIHGASIGHKTSMENSVQEFVLAQR